MIRRRGATMIYAVVCLIGLIGIASLAVDYGHVQLVKTELQRSADATARGHLALYQSSNYDSSYAAYYGAFIPTQTINPVDSASGQTPTTQIQWGTWNAATGTFTPGTYTSSNAAVKVTLSRTVANNNGINLTWAAVIGRRWSDVTVSSQSDPWLAGMPSGSGASYIDKAPAQSPFNVTVVPVVPGSYVSFKNVAGTIRHGTSLQDDGPEGDVMYSHGIDSPGGPTPAAENGIADVVMPIDAFLGVFLDDNRPDASAAPARRDYSTFTSRDLPSYDDIQLKQPFFIGDGQTSGGAVQMFKVPDGATRLYLGTMDGYQWANNVGNFTATIQVIQSISTVK